jgi:hypothetical protein
LCLIFYSHIFRSNFFSKSFLAFKRFPKFI